MWGKKLDNETRIKTANDIIEIPLYDFSFFFFSMDDVNAFFRSSSSLLLMFI
jgi:hypothetical protein